VLEFAGSERLDDLEAAHRRCVMAAATSDAQRSIEANMISGGSDVLSRHSPAITLRTLAFCPRFKGVVHSDESAF
jgi:hypothetical protein